MALTEFGKVVRTARIKTDKTMQQMANELATTPAFLSAMETGRKKVPDAWISTIFEYFRRNGVALDQSRLRQLADVANKEVSIEGLSPAQQMLVAGFARTNVDAEHLKNFEALLRKAMKG